MNFKSITLGDIVEITSSKRIFASDYTESGIPFYRSKEIIELQNNDKISLELFISEKKYKEILMKYGVPKKGDILLTSVGTLGVPYLVDNDEPFYFKDGNLTWFKNFNGVDSQYLYYFLNSLEAKRIFNEITIGSTQKALTIIALKNIAISLPDIKNQKLIARKICSMDNKIKVNIAHIRTLTSILISKYTNWFNNFNYPNNTNELENDIPEGWEYKPLNLIVDRITQKNNPLQTEITITVSAKDGITSDYYKKRVASKDLSKYTVVNKGDFIYNRSASTGYPVGVIRRLEEFEKVALSPIYFCLRAKSDISSTYLKYYFDSTKFTDELSQIVGIGARGHGMLNFNLNDFMSIPILLPSKDIVLKFEEFVAPFEKKIALLKEENKVLAEIRDTLLPKLMSGELSVEVGEQ